MKIVQLGQCVYLLIYREIGAHNQYMSYWRQLEFQNKKRSFIKITASKLNSTNRLYSHGTDPCNSRSSYRPRRIQYGPHCRAALAVCKQVRLVIVYIE